MKKTILFLTAITIFTNAFSQIKQGTWMGGGNLGYFKTNKNYDSYSNPYNRKDITRQFNLNLNIGYFIKDNLAIGLSPNYSHYKYSIESNNISSNNIYNYDSKNRDFGIAPFIRIYKQLFSSKLYLFGQGSLDLTFRSSPFGNISRTINGVITNNAQTTSKSTSYGISLSPGINYFLTDKIALEVFFAGLSVYYKNANVTETNQTGNTVTINTHKEKSWNSNFNLNLSSINLGVQFFLAKK